MKCLAIGQGHTHAVGTVAVSRLVINCLSMKKLEPVEGEEDRFEFKGIDNSEGGNSVKMVLVYLLKGVYTKRKEFLFFLSRPLF